MCTYAATTTTDPDTAATASPVTGTHGPRNVRTTAHGSSVDDYDNNIIHLLLTFLYNILPNNIFIYINNGNVCILLLFRP